MPRPPQGGADGDGETDDAEPARDSETEAGAATKPSPGGARGGGECGQRGVRGDASQGARAHLGRRARARRLRARRADVRASWGTSQWEAGARTGVPAHGAAASRRDAAASARRVPGAPSNGLPLHDVLPALSRLVLRATAVDAPGACRRRQALRRLLRQEAVRGRSGNRGACGGRAVCRRARRVELHVRRGNTHSAGAGLDRQQRPRARIHRRRAGGDRARPAEVGGDDAVPVRPGVQRMYDELARITERRFFRRALRSPATRRRSRWA